MKNIQPLINKLLLGFRFSKGRDITLSQEQIYSRNLDKVYTKYILDEYHHEKQEIKSKINFLRKTNKSGTNNMEIGELREEIKKRWPITGLEFYKKIDVLQLLIEKWKEGEEIGKDDS